MLAKFWYPLDEYTKHTIEGLQRGDFNIVVPDKQSIWEKLERGKLELSENNLFGRSNSD